MSRTIVLGCGVLLMVAVGCGGGSSTPGGTGGAAGTGRGGAGGTATGGAGPGGAGTGGTGTGGTATGGTGGATTGGTGGAGTGGGGTAGTGPAGTGGATGGGQAGGGGTGGGGTGGTPGPRTVTFASADPLAFAAAQDGSGPWQAFTGGVGSNYGLEVTGERYGIAYACAGAAGSSIAITVIQATVTETTRVTAACGGLSTASPVTISGTVSGLSSAQTAQVDIASKSASVTAAAPTYSLSVPAGTWDLFARRMTTAPTFDRMIRRNAITAAAGATLNLDFATEGFAPETRTVTFQGVSATETTGLLVIFRNTLGGSPFGLGSPSAGSYFAIPAAQLRTGDYHSIVASASDPATGGRRVRRVAIAATDFTAVMPPMIAAPVIAVGTTTPYLRPRASIPAGLASDRYDIGYSQVESSPNMRTRSWALQLTRGWITAANATDYTVPDLSAITGFQAWWGLVAGATNWQQFSQSSNGGVPDLLRADQTPAALDGREYKITQRDGTVTF